MIVYSRPPYPDIAYPYLLINAYNETTWHYIRKSTHVIESLLIDSGVYSIFHRLEMDEYPGGYKNWIAKVASLWRTISRHVKESYAVIPDYPADYDNNPIDDNVERTFRNIEYATKHHTDVKWVIPLQGKKDDVVSIVKSFEYVRDMGLLSRYGYVAIAPTTYKLRSLRDVAQIVWKRVKQFEKSGQYVKIHMFGVTPKVWKDVAHYVDSTDAIVGNIWCKPLIGKMCTKKEEKVMVWRMFLERISQVYAIRRL
jgi:hypothetical protein